MSKKTKITTLTVVGFSIILFFVFFLTSTKKVSPPLNSINKTSGVNIGNSYIATILEINNTKYEGEITRETSVYDFMSKLRKEGKINFTEKNYIGIGKFIVSINGVEGNGEKNWIYYVNGKEAQVGVSDYKINVGDTVSWKYEKANY